MKNQSALVSPKSVGKFASLSAREFEVFRQIVVQVNSGIYLASPTGHFHAVVDVKMEKGMTIGIPLEKLKETFFRLAKERKYKNIEIRLESYSEKDSEGRFWISLDY